MQYTRFELTATRAYAATRLRTLLFSWVSWPVYLLLLSPAIAYALLREEFRPLVILTLLLAFGLLAMHCFICDQLENNERAPLSADNLADQLSYNLVRHMVARRALDAAGVIAAASESDRGVFVLHQIGIERADLLEAFAKHTATTTLEECLQWGLECREELGIPKVDSTVMIFAFFKHVDSLKTLLDTADISIDDLREILRCEGFHFYVLKKMHEFSAKSLVRTLGGVGREWVMGYTNDLDRLTTDLTEHILSKRRNAVIHTRHLTEMIQALRGTTHNNMLILGRAGTGKRTMIENLAYALHKDEMANGLPYTRVLVLKTALLLSGVANRDRFLLGALEHADKAGRFVLVIEDLPLLLKAADPALKEVLLRFLQAKNINLIGISDTQDYHTIIKSESLIDNLFDKVYLDDADDQETMQVLLELYFRLERKRKVRITYKALKSIVEYSLRYIGKGGMPGKAVAVLNDAVIAANNSGSKLIGDDHIRQVVSRRANMDIRQLSQSERDRLLHLEDALHKNIVGQQDAIHVLVSALKRAKLEISSGKRPLGTFLFLGPTGVGKTETAKTLAAEYFGSEQSLVRIDLNEYSTQESVTQLIGGRTSTNGAFTEGFLMQKIQDRPFSLILLDEIEKAHPHVLNVFLQILDEGSLIDGRGVKTDFRNTIIIATSNAGGLYIRDLLKADPTMDRHLLKAGLTDHIMKERLFSPEFFNRFDEVIMFCPLRDEEVTRLAITMLDHVISDFHQKKGIRIKLDRAVLEEVVKRGYSLEFGAREMRRKIMETIENHVADTMLKRNVKRGDEIQIRGEDLQK